MAEQHRAYKAEHEAEHSNRLRQGFPCVLWQGDAEIHNASGGPDRFGAHAK